MCNFSFFFQSDEIVLFFDSYTVMCVSLIFFVYILPCVLPSFLNLGLVSFTVWGNSSPLFLQILLLPHSLSPVLREFQYMCLNPFILSFYIFSCFSGFFHPFFSEFQYEYFFSSSLISSVVSNLLLNFY